MATKKNEHADYIEKTYSGGLSAYTKTQQDRYNEALAKDNVDLINRLNADANRVGYSLSGPQASATPATPSYRPSTPSYRPKTPSYMTGADMAKNLGIDYNYQNILNKLNQATSDEYALKNKEYATTENQFYNQMYGAQGTALDTIRKSQAQAIATGASRGLQSANELSSMLGLQQETVMGATELAQNRNMLKDKEAGAYTQNVVNATDNYNNLGMQLGTAINNKYAADIQNNVGLMEYFKGLDQNAKNLEGNMYAADRGLEGNKYTADQNLAGNKYTADQNLAGVDLSSGRNLEGQLDYNQTYLQASKAQAEATKYAANVNASVQKAYYDSMNAQGPDDVFKLLNDAKTEDEYVLVLVGGSQGHITVDMAKEFWKNRNVKAANDALTQYILSKPYGTFGTFGAGSLLMPEVPTPDPYDWLRNYDDKHSPYYTHK